MFGSSDFRAWLHGDVKKAEAFYQDDLAPALQARNLIKSFETGAPFKGSKLFKKMSPLSDDIFELRSPDLRFFGWFPKIDHFIAVRGDLFENLKADTSLYEQHRLAAVGFRQELDLDEPKYTPGAGEQDVVSE